MRKAIIASVITILLSSLGNQASADVIQRKIEPKFVNVNLLDLIVQMNNNQTMLEKQQEEYRKAVARTEAIDQRIQQLKRHVGKTWYVFSGITPDGWDCSGMVMWFYSEFGIELEHSVTKQMRSGEIVKYPQPGDIIAFKYPGAENGYHNGIYIGDGKFIHSPKPGDRTKISSVSDYEAGSSKIVYTRINIDVLK